MKKSLIFNSLAGAITLALLSVTGPAFAGSHNGVPTDAIPANRLGEISPLTAVDQPANNAAVKTSSTPLNRANLALWRSQENAVPHGQSAQSEKPHKKSDEESPNNGAQQTSATLLQQIIVTGAPTFHGVTRGRASYSITTAGIKTMRHLNAFDPSQILSLAPGIFVEPMGGPQGDNVQILGFPTEGGEPFVTWEIEGMPVLNGLTSPIDIGPAVAGVSFLQGGPAVVTGGGQFGVTANVKLRTGSINPYGEMGVGLYSEGGERLEGFYGFPVTKDGSWLGSIGGYYQRTDGIRDPGYSPNQNKAVTMTLKHGFGDKGSLLFYFKYSKQRAEWMADYPLRENDKHQFSSFPGFPGLTGTYYSRADRFLPLQNVMCTTANCNPRFFQMDTGKGRSGTIRQFGSKFNYQINDWLSISNGFEYDSSRGIAAVMFNTGPNPFPLSEFIAQAEGRWGLPTNLKPTATFTTGAAVPLDTLVMEESPNYFQSQFHGESDQFKLHMQLTPHYNLTLGTYVGASTSHGFGNFAYDLLINAHTKPTPIVLSLAGPEHTYQVTDSHGLYSAWFPFFGSNNRSNGTSQSFNVFMVNHWTRGKWDVQFGGRLSRNRSSSHIIDSKIGDLDLNPYTLYNNTSTYLSDDVVYNKTGYVTNTRQYSGGVSYSIHPNLSAYARYTVAQIPPSAGSFQFLPIATTEDIHIEDAGVKYANSWTFLNVNAYHRMFYNIQSGVTAQNGVPRPILSGTDSWGVNFQGTFGPFDGLSLRYNASYLNGHYTGHPGCVGFTGVNGEPECATILNKMLQQQPHWMALISPAYTVKSGPVSWRFWANLQYLGNRFSDFAQTTPIGHYYDLTLGVQARFNKHWVVTLRGRNVTNYFGMDEGNLRLFAGGETNGVIQGRTIEGREVNLQVRYEFGGF